LEPVGAARLLLVEAALAGVPVDVFPAGAPVEPADPDGGGCFQAWSKWWS
jgi:hypothetical protein